MLAEAPAGRRERVGHLRRGEPELDGERGVAVAVTRRQVVALEQRERQRRASRRAVVADGADGPLEQRTDELLMEERVGVERRRRQPRERVALGALEVERHELHVAAAFGARGSLLPVLHEAVGAEPHERTEPGLGRIEALQPPFLERLGEEALRGVLRVVGIEMPGQPEVGVERFPVAGDQVAEGLAPDVGAARPDALDDRVPRHRKARSAVPSRCG